MNKFVAYFLDDADKKIVLDTLAEFGVICPIEESWDFSKWDILKLDGDFTLVELQALTKSMERMAARRAPSAGSTAPSSRTDN